MEKIVIGLLVFLIAIGIVQAYEAIQLKEVVSQGVSFSTTPAPAGSASTAATPPPALQSLPDMVGGC